MFGLRTPELLVILVVFLIMFGPKKLPEMGESLGKGIRAFKKAMEHGLDEGERAEGAKPGQLPQARGTTSAVPTPTDKANTDGGTSA